MNLLPTVVGNLGKSYYYQIMGNLSYDATNITSFT
jgi:hypothetical protein